MDYSSGTSDPNKISSNETDNIPSSNLVYTSLLRACEEAVANYFDVPSTAVATKDDFSILRNEPTQTHSKLMDTNLDDIEMNDELLDKLVTAILQDDTVDLHTSRETSNLPVQPQLSCNRQTLEPNSSISVSDNTLQVWHKLLGDNSILEQPQAKSSTNPDVNPRSAAQNPKPFLRRLSEDIFHRSLTRSHSLQVAASTTPIALPKTLSEVSSLELSLSTSSSAKRKTVSTTNSKDERTSWTNSTFLESCETNSSGPLTRSRSASKASQSHATTIADISTGYNLRARSSAGSQSNASCTSQSRSTNIRQRTSKDNSISSHRYETRSRTGSKVKATERRCTNLAVVMRRVRMSMIASLRRERSSIRLPTPNARLEPRSLPTPEKRLRPRRLAISKAAIKPQRLASPKKRRQPRRLSRRKARVSASGKSSRHASSVRKR